MTVPCSVLVRRLAAVLSLSAVLGCGSQQDDCVRGTQGCWCTADMRCTIGTTCVDLVCRADSGTVPGAGGGTGIGGNGSGGTGADGSVSPDNASPAIVMIGKNAETLHPGETLVVSAMVTDPDGAADLVGGTLKDPLSGATYGPMSGSSGSYSLSLSWDAIDMASPIATPVGGATRTFTAEFMDSAGHVVSQDVTVTLACSDATLAACGSDCVDPLWDWGNCGTCGHSCTYDCSLGSCFADVVSLSSSSCDAVCASSGLTCAGISDEEDGGTSYGYAIYTTTGCTDTVLFASCSQVSPIPSSVVSDCYGTLSLDSVQCYCLEP
ncbi:MAG TPA: hypothetical protein PLU22_14140 [Polyangiaceae bacterium]|nr:hypothetical protein [Polyangiaceae bacterium]